MFDRMVNQLSAAAATTSTGVASTTSAQAAAALMRFGGITADRGQDRSEEPLREEDGLLSVDIAEQMLKWHAEAIGRCVELSPASDVWVHRFYCRSVRLIPYSALKTPSLYPEYCRKPSEMLTSRQPLKRNYLVTLISASLLTIETVHRCASTSMQEWNQTCSRWRLCDWLTLSVICGSNMSIPLSFH